MKFTSFRIGDADSWGAMLDADHLVDLGPSGLAVAETLRAAVADGLPRALPSGAVPIEVGQVQFQPVVPNPGKIICVGSNYRTHRDEAGRPPAPGPAIFARFADSQCGHDQPVTIPSESEQLDYEGELALVIGRPAWRLARSDAARVVAGYACYNDFSVRDWQRHTTQWTPGKNFPGTGAFGPYLVTSDEIDDVSALELTTRVNGDLRQRAPVADLLFDIPTLLEYVTTFTALEPGDVVVTGTPGGVGLFMSPPQFLAPGDVVEVAITRLGILRNRVVAAAQR